MIEPIAITAALSVPATATRQKLRKILSVNGAGFVRFLYGAPTSPDWCWSACC